MCRAADLSLPQLELLVRHLVALGHAKVIHAINTHAVYAVRSPGRLLQPPLSWVCSRKFFKKTSLSNRSWGHLSVQVKPCACVRLRSVEAVGFQHVFHSSAHSLFQVRLIVCISCHR